MSSLASHPYTPVRISAGLVKRKDGIQSFPIGRTMDDFLKHREVMKELLKTRRESVLCIKESNNWKKVETIQVYYTADQFLFTRPCFQQDLQELSEYEQEEEEIIFEDDPNDNFQWRRSASMEMMSGYRDDDFTKSPFISQKRKVMQVGSNQKKRRIAENEDEESSSSDDDEFFDAEQDTTIDAAPPFRVTITLEIPTRESARPQSPDSVEYYDAMDDVPRPQSPLLSPAFRSSSPMNFRETIDPIPQTPGTATKPCILTELLAAIESPPLPVDNDRREEDSGLGEGGNYYEVPPLMDELDEDLIMDYTNNDVSSSPFCSSPTHALSPLVGSNDIPLQDSPGFITPAGSLEYSVADPVASPEDSYEQWLASQNKGDAEQSYDPIVSPAFELTDTGPSQIDFGILLVDSMLEDVSLDQSGRFDSAEQMPSRTRKAISDEYEIPHASRSLEDTLPQMAMHPADKEEILLANVSTPGPDSYEAWLASQNPTPEQHTMQTIPSAPARAEEVVASVISGCLEPVALLRQDDPDTPETSLNQSQLAGTEDPRYAELPPASVEWQETRLEPQVDSTESSEETEDLRSEQSPDYVEGQDGEHAATNQTHSPTLIDRRSAERKPSSPRRVLFGRLTDKESPEPAFDDWDDIPDANVPALQFVSEDSKGSEPPRQTDLGTPIEANPEDKSVNIEDPLLTTYEALAETTGGITDQAIPYTPITQVSPFLCAQEAMLEPQGDSTVSSEETEDLRSEQSPGYVKGQDGEHAATNQPYSPPLIDRRSVERKPSPPRQVLSGRLTDKASPESAVDNGDDAPDANAPALQFVSEDSKGSEPPRQTDLDTPNSVELEYPPLLTKSSDDLTSKLKDCMQLWGTMTSVSKPISKENGASRDGCDSPVGLSSAVSSLSGCSREGSPQRTRTFSPELYIDTMAHDRYTPALPSSSSSLPSDSAIRVESNMRSRNSTPDISALRTPSPHRTPIHHKVYPDLAPELQTELRAGHTAQRCNEGIHVQQDPSTPHKVESSRSQPKLTTEYRANNQTPKISISATSRKATPLPRVARLAITQSARKYQTPSRRRVYADRGPTLETDSRAKARESTLPHEPQSPASIPGSLNLIPLRREEMFQKREQQTAICTSQFDAHLHPTMGPCDRCWSLASPVEQAKFKARGTHLCIGRTRGGCDRNCKVFPPEEDEHAVRLCRQCFTATHKQGQFQVYRGNHRKVK